MDNAASITCWCVIPRAANDAILVRNAAGRYQCTTVPLRLQRTEFFPDHIPAIRKEILASTGIDGTVLRHLVNQDTVQICLIEIQGAPDTLPDGYHWLEPSQVADVAWADEESQMAWRAWSDAIAVDTATLQPWERAGWFGEARQWIESRLDEAHYRPIGQIEQVKGAWGWSSILQVETDRGPVYFKADYARPPKEVEVILKLAERWPGCVPDFIAVDIDRNWMLMPDFGGTRMDGLDPASYGDAVSRFAQIQRSTAAHIDSWRSLGCPDMTPESLSVLARQLVADKTALCEVKGGLTLDEWEQLYRSMPAIEAILNRLAASTVPSVVSSEDFRAGNVMQRADGYVFFDWGNTVITHPFFGINYFLNRMSRPEDANGFLWRNELEDDLRQGLAATFLGEWRDYAPWEQLVDEFWLCRRIYHLYEAVKCYTDLPYIGTTAPWGANARDFIPQAARTLLTSLDYQPANLRLSMP